jgi:hypothetical protein
LEQASKQGGEDAELYAETAGEIQSELIEIGLETPEDPDGS